ncbi:MAG: DUF1592 domain-containing protein [Planctomycetes bacterium]|nr:DUF1592 domain-containing protein [Planctomycetota bacterium]
MPVCTITPLRLATIALAILFAVVDAYELRGEEVVAEAKAGDAKQRGQAVYEKSCASCHGKEGEGVEEFYADPLVGDLTVAGLTEVIAETMPEDDPESCLGDDAAAVAAYIHKSFYSKVVQITAEPPRVRLARLTGNQLRQSLADLYAASVGVVWPTHDHGIKGLYFNGPSKNNDHKRLERSDPVIDFDFGHRGPGEGIDPKDFSITWRGAIRPDATGNYEIVVDSTCSFVCYLGSYERKFIDNHVQSGDKTEFRRSITLSAGRVYPIRIDFVQRKRKTEQPPAKIRLAWKPPYGTEQVIPSRNLVAVSSPATFALQTKLPADDRSYGYARGITVDKQWDESTTNAALEFAQFAAEELWPAYQRRHRNDSNENRGRLRAFLVELATTAFRGPLQDEDRNLYIDKQVDATEDDVEAIKRALLISLKSPRFLYPMLDSDRSKSQRVANRLALTLHDSLPTDKWLVQAVRSNQLEEETQVREAARRLVYDYRTRGKVRELMYQWLNLDQASEMAKDEEKFAGFDQELVGDLRASLDAFLDEVIWGESGDYRQLFLADWTFTNQRLATFYGETWNPLDLHGQGLRRSVSDSERRIGVLSHPYLMGRLSYHNQTSPIHRGIFLIRYVLGRTLLPPQDAFTPLAPDLHPDLTTRERVELQTSPKNCQICHEKINGLGFTLENFDAVGRYRPMERGREVNAAGSYTTREGEKISFNGPGQLAGFLATSEDAQRAFVNRTFQHFVKQPVAAFGPDALDQLIESFKNNNYSIRELLIEIAVVAATDLQEKPNGQENSDESPAKQT